LTVPDPSRVELLVLDVDGVMTDGSILLDDDGRETKRFHVRDGFGVKLWQRMGFRAAIITGRAGRALRHRATELGIVHVVQGVADKGAALDALLREAAVPPERAACLADDWPELPLMRRVGYPMAVADAHARIRAAAAFVTTQPGGRGAVREAIEHLLRARGLLEQALTLYDT
jgi:3-deoxy-D-manno-octulosonate 8-phosphate phosphatase (KDO 8-P phosphatase)